MHKTVITFTKITYLEVTQIAFISSVHDRDLINAKTL